MEREVREAWVYLSVGPEGDERVLGELSFSHAPPRCVLQHEEEARRLYRLALAYCKAKGRELKCVRFTGGQDVTALVSNDVPVP